MKLNEIRVTKLGTIQFIEDEDMGKCYKVRHNFITRECYGDTIKEALEMLADMQEDVEKLNSAIRTLKQHGYKVYKEVDRVLF